MSKWNRTYSFPAGIRVQLLYDPVPEGRSEESHEWRRAANEPAVMEYDWQRTDQLVAMLEIGGKWWMLLFLHAHD